MTLSPTDLQHQSPRDPLRTYASVAGVGGVALLIISGTVFGPGAAALWIAAIAFYAAASAFVAHGLWRSYPHGVLGYCNAITQLRLLLLCLVALAIVAEPVHAWAAFGVAALAFALDGLDGWMARREGLVSEFGASFDMEVDSLLALTLALGAMASGAAGPLVLLLGVARYLYGGAAFALPWLANPLPERFSRKAVCVAQIATLVALQAPVLPAGLGDYLTAAVALALNWSFAVDIRWQWRARHRLDRAA